MQARLAWLRSTAQFDGQLGSIPDKPIRNLDDIRVGNREPDRGAQPGRQQLVGQHPHMLGIVAEFDHIEIARRMRA